MISDNILASALFLLFIFLKVGAFKWKRWVVLVIHVDYSRFEEKPAVRSVYKESGRWFLGFEILRWCSSYKYNDMG